MIGSLGLGAALVALLAFALLRRKGRRGPASEGPSGGRHRPKAPSRHDNSTTRPREPASPHGVVPDTWFRPDNRNDDTISIDRVRAPGEPRHPDDSAR
jgi:hypothetical protein